MEGVTNNRLNSKLERQQFRQLTDWNLWSYLFYEGSTHTSSRDSSLDSYLTDLFYEGSTLVVVILTDPSFTLVVHASWGVIPAIANLDEVLITIIEVIYEEGNQKRKEMDLFFLSLRSLARKVCMRPQDIQSFPTLVYEWLNVYCFFFSSGRQLSSIYDLYLF